MMKAGRRGGDRLGILSVAVIVFAMALPQLVTAQGHGPLQPGQAGRATPDLPRGPAAIRGRVVHRDNPAAGRGVAVSLYALNADGSPGMGDTQSDAEGRFAFEGLSNEPGVVYLLSTQHEGVPFGRRVAFESGQTEVKIDLAVAPFTDDVSEFEVIESTTALDRVGRHLLVREVHLVRNRGEGVIHVKPALRQDRDPIFRATLPENANGFMDGQAGMAGKLVRDGDSLQFWGPAYPGEQKISYQYSLSLPTTDGEDSQFDLLRRFPSGTGRVVVLSATDGPTVTSPGLEETGEKAELGGRSYRKFAAPAVRAGGSLALALVVPQAESDPNAVSVVQANFWVHMDDTSMEVTGEWELRVESPGQVMAAPGESLLRIDLPTNAEFLGVASATKPLGLEPTDDGRALELRGPLAPGKSNISYRFRAPVQAGASDLELDFTRQIPVLNMLVADVGIVIESSRLHRRRPFRSGTRIYLHRQAFQLDPGEKIAIDFRPLERGSLPRSAAVTGILAIASLGAWFLIAPLRTREARAAGDADTLPGLSEEREYVYESMRDLEHDFETGKLDPDDYERMKSELRADAVELLRRERTANEVARPSSPSDASSPSSASSPSGASSPSDASADATPTARAFCPSCGGRIAPIWSFCSHCGGPLQPSERTEAGE